MYAIAVDLNRWSTCDFNSLKQGGVSLAIPKCSQGSYNPDPKFLPQMFGARDAGMNVACFHWLDPLSGMQAQVDFVCKILSPYVNLLKFVAVDIEQWWSDWTAWDRMRNGLIKPSAVPRFTPSQISNYGKTFCAALQERLAGLLPVYIYTNAYFILEHAPVMQSWIPGYKLWWSYWPYDNKKITCSWADFYSYYLPKTDNPLFPSSWTGTKDWAMWQFTGDKFILPGVQTVVDVNFINAETEPPPPPVIPERVAVNVSALNIREGAGTEYEIIATTSYGKVMTVSEAKLDSTGRLWYRTTGWIASWLTKPVDK